MKIKSVNTDIALTHILSQKKQTLVAALGVTIGISIFIFLNSLVQGFSRYSDESLFKSVPHLRVYKEDEMSTPLLPDTSNSTPVLINPKISNLSKNLINPKQLLEIIKDQSYVVAASPQVSLSVFYKSGNSQINGVANGVMIAEENAMFNLQSSMVEGNALDLQFTTEGIIIGVGIADQFNILSGDFLTVVSADGVIKNLKVIGIFETGSATVDKTKSYINLNVAQQMIQESPSYVTDIYVNTRDPDMAPEYVDDLESITRYQAEDWQTANAAAQAGGAMRNIILLSISVAVLLVGGFGIYNILNMTVSQKINEIAILKATGFRGRDVIKIFLQQAIIIGILGGIMGLILGAIIVIIMKNVYVGGNIKYFPIQFEPDIFLYGFLFGLAVTTVAGYIPAKNAANIDPVQIFRK